LSQAKRLQRELGKLNLLGPLCPATSEKGLSVLQIAEGRRDFVVAFSSAYL
jgi:hypothetical protein